MTNLEKVNTILKEIKPTKDLETIEDIIDGGYLDSFELMALITKLQDEFSTEIPFDEITPENFNSAKAMADMAGRLAD